MIHDSRRKIIWDLWLGTIKKRFTPNLRHCLSGKWLTIRLGYHEEEAQQQKSWEHACEHIRDLKASKGNIWIFGAGVRIFVARPSSLIRSSSGSEDAKKYVPNLRVPFYAGSAYKPSTAASWFTVLLTINPNSALSKTDVVHRKKKNWGYHHSHTKIPLSSITFHKFPIFFHHENGQSCMVRALHRSAWEHEGSHLRAMMRSKDG